MNAYICNYILRNDKTHLLSLFIHQNIMADSVYISSNLTSAQMEFMKLLDEYEVDIFRFEEIEGKFDRSFGNLNEILENLVHKGILSRIERGKFCKANFRDEKVIGAFLVNNGAIAYWSALNLYGLTEQFPNTVFVQTTNKKKDKTIFGVSYQFIQIADFKRAGVVTEGFGNHSYYITDIEKTLVDCFDLPQYSGGYAELIRAFATAKLSGAKMIDYCRAINNIAATKRMGYLAELFEKKGLKSFISFAKEQIKDAYNPFDPHGHDSGFFIAEWRLKLNITKDELLDIANKQY
jgi:predicted transcriptional regulator of viral defense system